ncbi:MAG: hypothetical protein MPK30_05370 [Gammaproteobacteria bacterium]|nr:hypothetical protein [Gammaproteobacteria bacterium]
MGRISEIYTSYKSSLDLAQDEYEDSVRTGSKNAREFYDAFFKDLTINMGKKLESKDFVDMITDEIERFFGKRDLSFIAVDGSCDKHTSGEFISFYGGAYGAKGVLSLSKDRASVEYRRWEIDKDVSMVAFVPIPYSRIHEVDHGGSEEEGGSPRNIFAASESDKLVLTSMHLPIMQLAEVFLAYNSATSSNLDSPDIILIDNSLSGMLGYNDFKADSIRLVGKKVHGVEMFDIQDAIIAHAHPFNGDLNVPSTKHFTEKASILRFLHENGPGDVSMDMISRMDMPRDRLERALKRLQDEGIINRDSGTITQVRDVYKSWENTKVTFQRVCKAIFVDKRENALKFDAIVEGRTVTKWMSPDDVKFLIAVGLRALIEECWSKRILLIGIVKDSASTYLTKNYLGVCRHFGKYDQIADKKFGILPPTDRMFCELLPYIDDDLHGPWGTIEFDSTFMTLRVVETDGRTDFGGTFGGITRPECLFLRSIGQFYIRRNTESPLTGHAIFIDRLAFPAWDGMAEKVEIDHKTVGRMSPLFYESNQTMNKGQLATYYLLNTLTKNHFAEMIGYPDPLHKADQGAKSMRDSVRQLLVSSEIKFRSRPLINTLREIRRSFGR